jgi:mono/diheme cytochrome c family protein
MRAAGWRKVGLAAVLAGCVSVVGGCQGGGSAPAVAPAAPGGDPILVRGRSVYVSYCAECHGLTGAGRTSGRVAPSLHGIAGRITLEQQIDLVRRGRGLMPAHENVLTPDEIDAVVRYERSVF